MTHALLRFLVPRDWTGEQALAAVRLLRAASQAIWQVHGEEMALALGGLPPWDPARRGVGDDLEDDPEPDHLIEDDIPF